MLKKRYLTAFFILMILSGISLFLSDSIQEALRQRAFSLSGRILLGVDQVSHFAGKVDEGLKNLNEAKAEVERLESENKELLMQQELYRDLATENQRLRSMLVFKKESEYELLASRVISRDPSHWWNTVVINRGWYDDTKLGKDLPVVTPRGIVGKTGIVSPYTTQVILLVDENCRISAKVEGSHAQGIVVGEGILESGKPRARMKYLPRNTSIAVGERVFTSGLGGVFPRGLLIGQIIEVPPLTADRDFGLYREAVIEPNVDLGQLHELFILIGTKVE